MRLVRPLSSTAITFRVTLAFVGAVILGSCVAPAASAQSGQAFTISPALIELSANPGETAIATIKLTNLSSTDLSITTQANDFGSKNETGEPNIIFDDQATPYSMRSWIGLSEEFKIGTKESKTIDFPIKVPQDAEPGGHYSVIRFTGSVPGEEGSNVALSASIGSLIFLKVSGQMQQKASIASFYAAKKDFAASSFFETGPVSFVERIKNDGNVHLKPTGTIEVKNTFGKVVSTMRVNGDPGNEDTPPRSVLPQSIRRFDQSLEGKRLFGKYTATLSVHYGDPQQKLEQTISFWVIPYKLVGLIIAGIAILTVLLVFGIKKYNAHIIKKAQSSNTPPPPQEPTDTPEK